jgi:SAM-dependent methyltransferase
VPAIPDRLGALLVKDKKLIERIATISPEKRELLERLLRKKTLPTPSASTTEDSLETSTARSFEEQARELNSSGRPWNWDIKAEKSDTQRVYDAYHEKCDSTVFGKHSFFMNLGYVPNDNKQYSPIQLPAHIANKHSIKLALEVIGDCDLTDRDVLDAGCGRGGTIHLIHQYFNVRSMVGIDLSPRAIAFCRKVHEYPNARFMIGDAEKLSVADATFDVVINIESSHSYPDRLAFYQEVWRVLRTAGCFVYADVLPEGNFLEAAEFLKGLGFDLERDQDITSNVLASCDDTAGLQLQAFARSDNDKWMANALGAPGSHIYNDMKNCITAFRILKFRKV